jgi:hypothetical protein
LPPLRFCSFLCVHRQLDERMRARVGAEFRDTGKGLDAKQSLTLKAYSPRLSFTAISISCSGPEIAFGCLDRRVAEQEFDLLQIPAVLSAQLGTRPAEIVGAEVLNPDLLR